MNSNPSRPWFFDQTPETVNDIPNQTHYDFLTTALHELGHILGFLRNRGLPFTDLVKHDGFAGLKAKEFNNGAPIPLAPGSSHIAADYSGGLIRPNLLNQMMASFDQIQGYRTYPSRLDASILEDLGYNISETPSKYHPLNLSLGNATYSSPYQDLHPTSRRAPSYWTVDGTDPKGLWFFDNSEQLNSALIGTPVLYAPPKTGLINEIAFEDGVKVPTGEFLYTEHGLTDGNCGGEGVNCYSIVFDIRLPKLGDWYSLLNTSSHNTNDGDLWISPEGSFGQWTYSSPVIDANEWVSLIYTVDLSKGEQSFYANGDLVHFQTSETYEWMDLDGRHALGIMPDEYPFFTLFADDDGEDAEIEVRRVAFYDFPLNAKQVKALSQSVLEHCCVVREVDTSIEVTERIAGPEKSDLEPVYPNPFNSTVMVPLSVPQAVADLELGVYNVLGQRVRVCTRAPCPQVGTNISGTVGIKGENRSLQVYTYFS